MNFRAVRPVLSASILAFAALAGCHSESKEACCADGACTDECKDKGAATTTPAAATTTPAAETASAPINANCPIRGGAVNASYTVAYEGKTIGFCCGGCKKAFEAKDDAGKKEILASITAGN